MKRSHEATKSSENYSMYNPVVKNQPQFISYKTYPSDNEGDYFTFLKSPESFDWEVKIEDKGKTFATTIVWFKNDLRIMDNPALYFAAQQSAENSQNQLLAVYVFCLKEFRTHQFSDCKIMLIIEAIRKLQGDLNKYGIPLLVCFEDDSSKVPFVVAKLCHETNCKGLFFNRQYEDDELRRDDLVEKLLTKYHQIPVSTFEDQCVIPTGTCKTKEGKDYCVFTPFKNTWLKFLNSDVGSSSKYLNIYDLDNLKINKKSKKLSMFELSYKKGKSCSLDEIAANLDSEGIFEKHWKPLLSKPVTDIAIDFIEHRASNYDQTRNFPHNSQGTSKLSPYLAIGMISAKYLVVKTIQFNKGRLPDGSKASSSGLSTWINEICWRDFYRNILVAFPRIIKGRPFKLETDKVEWNTDVDMFEKWCAGLTGFPIVDAGMRQLNATGWMHNRLRMVTAMFLTKDLLVDWRWGESYFMSKLIDGDFPSNNGGWQWSASTGTDAQPYFRVFNPLSQSEKFDADGEFIKTWVPELRSLKDPKMVHDPSGSLSKEEFKKLSYPPPIVDHRLARLKAIEAFKRVFAK